MKNVMIEFKEFDGTADEIPSGYQEIKFHMTFDIKMGENFRHKARIVAGGTQQILQQYSHIWL